MGQIKMSRGLVYHLSPFKFLTNPGCRETHLWAGGGSRNLIARLEVWSNSRYTTPAKCDNLWVRLSLLREWGDQTH